MASYVEIHILFMIYRELLRGYYRVQSRFPDFVMSVIGACIIRLLNYISAFSYVTILFFVLFVSVVAIFLYRVNYMVLISIASFYLLCIANFDLFVFTLFSNLGGSSELLKQLISQKGIYRTIIILSIKLLWVLVFLLIRKYLSSVARKLGKGKMLFLISILGFLGVVFLIEQAFIEFDFRMTEVAFMFMILCILIVCMLYFIARSREEKMRSDFTEMRNKLLEENYAVINDLYTSNAQLYHDINNHLNVLYQLINNGRIDDAKSYIDEISKPVSSLAKTVWTGFDVIDVVINSKLQKMKENGIQANINVEFPHNTGIKPNDMCTILANLLDNAIEATEKAKKNRIITIIVRRINHFIFIKISNPCLEVRDIHGQYPLTTKENKKFHGWGIPSVTSSVDKYHGTTKFSLEDNQFVVTVMLCIEEN